MSVIKQIAEGFFNNLTNRKDDLYKERIDICRACPLYKTDGFFDEECNNDLYINKDNEVSKVKKKGFIKGCGCALKSKTRVDEAKCIINK